MAGRNVIQGYFPNGPPRLTNSLATAQLKTGPPLWVQQAIARCGPAVAQPKAPPAQPRIIPPPPRPQHTVLVPVAFSTFAAGAGQPLPLTVRQRMEAFFGTSFADVRIHVGPLAASIGAVAFTDGSNIHFAPGRYDPTTNHGQQIIGHELAHVVQQRAGRVRNPFGGGVAVVQDPTLESEAEQASRRITARLVLQRSSSSSSAPAAPAKTDHGVVADKQSNTQRCWATVAYAIYIAQGGNATMTWKEFFTVQGATKSDKKFRSNKVEDIDAVIGSGSSNNLLDSSDSVPPFSKKEITDALAKSSIVANVDGNHYVILTAQKDGTSGEYQLKCMDPADGSFDFRDTKDDPNDNKKITHVGKYKLTVLYYIK
jgi:hypothetical protein